MGAQAAAKARATAPVRHPAHAHKVGAVAGVAFLVALAWAAFALVVDDASSASIVATPVPSAEHRAIGESIDPVMRDRKAPEAAAAMGEIVTTTNAQNVANVALTATASSWSAGSASSGAATLVDGNAFGYYESEDGATACTAGSESDPWIEIAIAAEHEGVVSVEMHVPKRHCDSIIFKDAACIASDQQTANGNALRFELLDRSRSVVQTETFAPEASGGERPVYAWDGIRDARDAAFARIVAPGPARRICATEVKVYAIASSCEAATCKHGACDAGGACTCPSTRLGEHECGSDPLRDWVYLPYREERNVVPSRNFSEAWPRAYATLDAIQNPARACLRPKVVKGLIGPQGRGAGLASTLHFVAGHLSEALRKGTPFVFGGMFNYAGTAYCKERGALGDLDCYLHAVAGEACGRVKERARRKVKSFRVAGKRQNRCAIGRLCNDVSHFKHLPSDFEDAGMGLLAYRAVMAAYLARPNAPTASMLDIDGLKRRLGFASPMIGLHVRHGDACHTTDRKGRCGGLEAYMPALRTLAARYGTRRVFVSTDDDAVLAEAEAHTREGGEFDFVFTGGFNRQLYDSKQQIEKRKGLWDGTNDDGHAIMQSSLADVLLLAECDVFVLHLLSNLSRLALELAAARLQKVPPYISVDGPWCPHWKMCTT